MRRNGHQTSSSAASSGVVQRKAISRRRFLATGASAAIMLSAPLPLASRGAASEPGPGEFNWMDLHVHLDNSTIDKVLEISQQRNVKFGIVEHAGTKENVYPVVLSNDEELRQYLAMLKGKPVYRGIQTEWTDWMHCFSRQALAELDYVLTDAMTFPGKDGRRVKLWEPDATARVDMSDKQSFMDRMVDWNVEIIERQPIDILANVSWLPAPLAPDYDKLWTPARVGRVVAAAVKHRVALEISSGFKLPTRPFLEIAKSAGVKFTFGSNGRYPNMGKLDYSRQLAKELGLTQADLFTPAPPGQKAVERRK